MHISDEEVEQIALVELAHDELIARVEAAKKRILTERIVAKRQRYARHTIILDGEHADAQATKGGPAGHSG